MPWQEVSAMQQRREFVRLARMEGSNRRELCRRFGISPQTGYKWLARWAEGDETLRDRSRRPQRSPRRTEARLEQEILLRREAHPSWGARKLAAVLARENVAPPAASTVHQVLRRHERIVPPAGGAPATIRFEKPAPNQLWQMDFKGWFRLADAARCEPLTVLDDHARYLLQLGACTDQQAQTVRERLEATFRCYGLPDGIFVDNGAPWGSSGGERWTRFTVWLLKHGIRVLFSRPYHPQSRGKIERLHRTLDVEVLSLRRPRDMADAQRAFDAWREVYNHQRPHEALGQAVPASRYCPSLRRMAERLAEPEYDEGEIVRRVGTTKAYIRFKGRPWPVGQAFFGERLAIRPRGADGQYGVFFGAFQIASIDLTKPGGVHHVSEQVSTMSPD
jgi:transposase InsO family protein